MQIEVPSELAEKIVIEELKWHYDHLVPNAKPPMYSYDEEVDKAKVKKLRKALKRVLDFYGEKV